MRLTLGISLFVAMSIFSVVARAEEQPPSEVLGNLDLYLGVGGGGPGFAGHIGVGGQAWLGDVFGVGAQAGFLEGAQILGDTSSQLYFGPAVALRTSNAGTYAFFTAGAGIATRAVRHRPFCLVDPCSRPSWDESRGGWDVSLTGGGVHHLGSFEIGAMIRAESIADARIVTMNLILGVAMMRDSNR